MTVLGTVLSYLNNIVTATTLGKSLTRTAVQVAPYGSDTVPIKGMQALFMDTANPNNPVMVGYVNKQALAAVGENRHYATDANGNTVFNMWQRADGTLLIGTSVSPSDYIDNLVRYEKLLEGLTTYIDALNAAIVTGVGSAGGTYTPPTTPLDISAAKITEIKTQ